MGESHMPSLSWHRILQFLFFALALGFLILMVADQWDALRGYAWHLRPLWLGLSAVTLAGTWVWEVHIWRGVLHTLGGDLTYRQAWRVWFFSAIARYIPGNIWQPLSMTVMAQQHGVRAMATMTSIVVYQLGNLLSTMLIAALYFPLSENLGLLGRILPPEVGRWMALFIVPLILFLWRPQWLVQLVNLMLRRLGREPLPLHLTSRALLWVVASITGVWGLIGLSFLLLTIALSASPPQVLFPHSMDLIASYPLSYAAGYISFITPSGLGVREGVAYVLLAPVIGGATATIAALAMRLWLTLGELIAAGIGVLIKS